MPVFTVRDIDADVYTSADFGVRRNRIRSVEYFVIALNESF